VDRLLKQAKDVDGPNALAHARPRPPPGASSSSPSPSPSSSSATGYLQGPGPCRTRSIRMVGGGGWSLQLPATLARLGLSNETSAHLAHNYGDKALTVAALAMPPNASVCGAVNGCADATAAAAAENSAANASAAVVSGAGLARRLANGYPFIEAEVLYATQHEYAETAVDVLAHRTRLVCDGRVLRSRLWGCLLTV
jgi:glycerol-3-phosphate dehydrogenase